MKGIGEFRGKKLEILVIEMQIKIKLQKIIVLAYRYT